MTTEPPEFMSLTACRILVVEDNPRMQRLVEAFLLTMGITDIAFAGNGLEGLAKIPEVDPDLIVLDIMMPEMDGVTFLERLRANPAWRTIPVLVQTALGSPQDQIRIYAAGANDMLTKPLIRHEFSHRVRIHLENRMLSRAHEARMRIKAELDAARRMQEALLPPPALLEEIDGRLGLGIQAHFETSSELGGDFWGVHRYRSDTRRLAVFTVDFSGHGIGAALNTFRLHTLMSHFRPTDGDPAAYLRMLNEDLVDLLPRGQFATMFYGILDLEENTLTYSGAAAPPPLLGSMATGEVETLDASGIPLGMIRDASYDTRCVAFPPDSVLLLYSDALFESERRSGGALDLDGVRTLFARSLGQAEPLASLLAPFFDTVDRPLPDDLTAVMVRHRRGAPSSE